MKIGIISDVHGNPIALEAVLGRMEDVDLILNLGDLVGIGPWPSRTMDMIMDDRRFLSVMGNHCHNTVYGTELGPTDVVPRKPHHDWVRSQLSPGQIEFISEFPLHIVEEMNGISVSMMHRHPDDCGSPVPYYDTPTRGVVEEFYSGVEGDLILFGHTHIPLDIGGDRRYFNPGAVGAQNYGKASYGILEIESDGFRIRREEVPYDHRKVVEDIIDREVPYREFIIKNFFP